MTKQQQQSKIQKLPLDVLHDTYKHIFGQEKFDLLRQALIDCEAVVAGGGVLAPYASYEISDFDIYVNVEFVQDLYLAVRNLMGYHIAEHWGNVAPPYDESFFKKNNILARFRLYQEHFPSIDIMMIADDTPVRQVVTNFDLSFCQVWYDGQTVETTNRRDIETKRGFLQKDYQESLFQKFNWFILSRILKYNQRGFKVQVSMTPSLKDFLTRFQVIQTSQQFDTSRKPIFVNVTIYQTNDIIIHQDRYGIYIDILIVHNYGPYDFNYISNYDFAEDQRLVLNSPEEWVVKKIYNALIHRHHQDDDEDYERTVFWIMRHPLYPANMATINEYLDEIFQGVTQIKRFLIETFNELKYYNNKEAYLDYLYTYTGIQQNDLDFFYDQLRLPSDIQDGDTFLINNDQYKLNQQEQQMLKRFMKGQLKIAQLHDLTDYQLYRFVHDFNPSIDEMYQVTRLFLLNELERQKAKRQKIPKQRQLLLLRNFLMNQFKSKDEIKKLSKPNMLEVVREFNPTISQQTTKQQLYRLLDNQRVNRLEQKKASAEVQAQQSITDPFTFEYLKDPVFASDGGIYNRSTVQRLLAEMGMKYNSNRQLVPNYPRTARGIIDKYQTIQELQRTNPVKAQQLKQIRRKALEAQQV